MLRFTPYILKNLFGHRMRTAMTVLGTALLMFLFCFVSSIQQGLTQLTDPKRQDDRLIVFQAFRFCPSSSELPYPLFEDLIRKVPGVEEVLPIKVVVNNCRASLETVVFHGVPPDRLQKVRKLRFLKGSWDTFAHRLDGGAIVGRRLAERRGIEVGKPFAIAGVTVNVEGIFASDQPGEENIVYTHLAFLQQVTRQQQDRFVTMYEVHVADAAQSDAIARTIDNQVRERSVIYTDTKPQKAHYRRAVADLVELIGFTRWLGIVCVGVVGILVGNAVLMAAQDRVKEHAVLQTLGYTGWRILGLVLAESVIVSLTGGLLGIGGCVLWLYLQPLTISTEGVSIDFLASPGLALWGLGLATGVGVIAGLIPAWQAGFADITRSLRQ